MDLLWPRDWNPDTRQSGARNVATHAISTEGEPAASRDICKALEGCAHAHWASNDPRAQPLAHLAIGSAELGDDGVANVLDTLLRYKFRRLNQEANSAADAQDESVEHGTEPRRRPLIRLRTLNLDENSLTDKILGKLALYIQDNVDLLSLSLAGNDFHMEASHCRALAQALSSSNLRCLQLSSNPLPASGFAAFLDHLHAPNLVVLKLSAVLNDVERHQEAGMAAARLIRRSSTFILNASLESTALARYRTADLGTSGFAPRLMDLSLNANRLSGPDLREIALAVAGAGSLESDIQAHLAQPNRHLATLEHFVTGEFDWPPEGAYPAAAIENQSNSLELGSVLNRLRQERNPPFETSSYFRSSRMLSQRLLRDQTAANGILRKQVQEASIDLLIVARILGCRSRRGDSTHSSSFPFPSLPSELRLAILQMAAKGPLEGVLSGLQVDAVIQWACDPFTIGFEGQSASFIKGWDASHKAETLQSLIPVAPFNWKMLCARLGPWPKDYLARTLDEQRDHGTAGRLAFLQSTCTDAPDNFPLPDDYIVPESYWQPMEPHR